MKLPRNAELWLPGYIKSRVRRLASRRPPKRLWVAITDHYEPLGGVDMPQALERVAAWQGRWPEIAAAAPRDIAGNAPQYTFFYPQEEYRAALVAPLAEFTRAGIGDVEVHLHHDHETAPAFREKITTFCRQLHEDHGLLRKRDGQLLFGFIHGNWALDNSRPDGRFCGLTGEIRLLRELGCYADFTMPSLPSSTQGRIINQIYWTTGSLEHPKSFDEGVQAIPGAGRLGEMLMITGPLGLRFRGRLLPRMETGELAAYDPPTPYRVARWLALAPRLGDDIFLKLYTHGAREDNAGMLLGTGHPASSHADSGLANLFRWLHAAAVNRGLDLHWVTAYHMFEAIERWTSPRIARPGPSGTAPVTHRPAPSVVGDSHCHARRGAVNVLLITFSFPPAGGVGVLRALSLAKYLPEEGIRVDVLTARNAPAVGKDSSLLRQVPESVTVHRTWTLDLPFALRKAVKKLISGRAGWPAPSRNSAAASVTSTGSGNPVRRVLANLLLPDPQIGWLPFALPAARRIIRRCRIDTVIVTVPPFSSAALVTKLRRSFPALPIVLDFRDEWLTTTLHLVSFNSNERARTVAARTESEAVQSATAVVAVTEAARLELIARYPGEPAAKFVCIHNGFDTDPKPLAPPPTHADAARPNLTLTYLGTVYGSTDPSHLVEAVRSLPEDLRSRLHLRFIGHIERDRYRQALASLGDIIELRGFVPQAEALRAIDATDWLLLITHDRINVAAKFYDYLAGGKPIFAAVHPDGDVRRLLEQTGAGRWADGRDPAAIAALLHNVLAEPDLARSLQPRPEEIARFHRRVLAAKYASALRSLVATESRS